MISSGSGFSRRECRAIFPGRVTAVRNNCKTETPADRGTESRNGSCFWRQNNIITTFREFFIFFFFQPSSHTG